MFMFSVNETEKIVFFRFSHLNLSRELLITTHDVEQGNCRFELNKKIGEFIEIKS